MSSSRHLVDPQLLGLLDLWPTVALDEANLAMMREAGRLPVGEVSHPERVDRSDTLVRRASAPDVALILYRPAGKADETLPCIYHIHGGGYVGGQASAMEPIHRRMVEALGCALVTVDYRLAPETPHPGPIEDCYAGLDWLYGEADRLRIDRSRIGVMGESAGGGLAAGLALLTRDRGQHRLAFQHLIYPMIDDRSCTAADPHPHTGEFIWTPHNNAFGWRAYLGVEPGSEGVPEYAAPARAERLADLPPTFISTGTLDLFVEEDVAYAIRLLRAGVPTELHLYPGGYHGFDMDPAAAVAERARRDSLDALRRFLFPT